MPALAAERTSRAHRVGGAGLAGASIPAYALAALEALQIGGACTGKLASLSDREWRELLAFCDRAQLTLLLGEAAHYVAPAWVRHRIRENAATYALRFDRLRQWLWDIADALEKRGIEYAVLKGIAHSPDFTPDPLWRVSGDIDLWCAPERVLEVRDVVAALGFRVMGRSPGRHLPPMVRERQWHWTGDYFAADLPIPVELHYELWDSAAECISAPGASEFWNRRTTVEVDGRPLPVLEPTDALAFACLHLLMHILHGDLRLQRAWEIARFLDRHSQDETFWLRWHSLHEPSLRRLEALVLDLTAGWFGAARSPVVLNEIGQLPEGVQLWLERHRLSPIEALFHSRKDEIWLHLALIESRWHKCAVFLRRAFPAHAAAPAACGSIRSVRFGASRFFHHLRALPPTVAGAIAWMLARRGLGPEFLRFQLAASLYGFGVVIFVVLYNLFLLSAGFHEDFLGKVASVNTLGTVAGALPAAVLVRRAGLRAAILAAIAGAVAVSFARAVSDSATWQMAAAFVNGVFFSIWAVSYSPAVAAVTPDKSRQRAFSIACFTGMTVCSLGGLVAGTLPGWLGRNLHLGGLHESQRAALLSASALVCLALPAAARLEFSSAPAAESKVRPAGRFLAPFLFVFSVWAAAVGAFNPLFNSFFAVRLHMSAGRIGSVYSVSQAIQAAALLAAPVLLRRLGPSRGIAVLQLLCGMALVALALASSPLLGAAAYVAYCSFQYMAEPGLLSMLMGGVAPEARSSASALYFLTTSLAAAAAAWAAGAAIAHWGYPMLLSAASVAAAVSSLLTWRLFR